MNKSKTYRKRTSSGEFSITLRNEARAAMRKMFHREMERNADPVVELVTCLLEDGVGGVLAALVATVALDQWHTWNRLVLERPKVVSRMLRRIWEGEKAALPSEPEAMRRWAANLLLSSLDRLGMA